MEWAKNWIGKLYWIALIDLILYTFTLKQDESYNELLHFLASWLPPIGMLAVISGQLNLLSSIGKGNLVNIEARTYDLIHWLMLTAINIGVWMRGGVPIWWFILTLILLSIIGMQIGVGIRNKWQFTTNAKIVAVTTGAIVLVLGLFTGGIRYLDSSSLGWGWAFETLTAVVATVIVMKWILLDIKTISTKALGYPRAVFLKGIFSNALVLFFWVHVMTQQGFASGEWWATNAGLTFNVLIGNLIYLGYWLIYEYHRRKQTDNKNKT